MKTRRYFLSKTLVTLAGAALSPSLLTAHHVEEPLPLPTLQGRKILFTYGGWAGHDPETNKDYFVPWLEEQGATVVSANHTAPYADEALMDTIDLVIQSITMSNITREEEKGLLRAISNGTGMVGWHGGLCDSFRSSTAYQYMTGGQFVAHPGGIVDYQVDIVNKKDAINQGLSSFQMKSEQYYMHVDPNVKVLATTKFSGANDPWIEGCVVPVAWKKMFNNGRVFYSSLGHELSHLIDKPDALAMIQRGITWASASKYEPVEKWINPVYY
ncbi:ThuA domain-containing protein [Reichenbachiella carrageenanivorans]|uniref:ThuA domain-containing protein n=1 Tax=Reichenbachiella carrageenanivorans TaxID=2979869 RepID=A0ABY6D1T3_9BACT|nr:ThuA domain-containing protein [Reichenbachiella carrageenanivorans]UXX80122.1 ThuA domain-containing protein [Reichenbachiella carrageenanivorans]